MPDPTGWIRHWDGDYGLTCLPDEQLIEILLLLGEWRSYATALEDAGQWEKE